MNIHECHPFPAATREVTSALRAKAVVAEAIETATSREELTSTGVPTGVERQKRFGRFLAWLLETVRLRNAHELGVGARAEN